MKNEIQTKALHTILSILDKAGFEYDITEDGVEFYSKNHSIEFGEEGFEVVED